MTQKIAHHLARLRLQNGGKFVKQFKIINLDYFPNIDVLTPEEAWKPVVDVLPQIKKYTIYHFRGVGLIPIQLDKSRWLISYENKKIHEITLPQDDLLETLTHLTPLTKYLN